MYLLKHMHEMVSIPEYARSLDSLRSLEMTVGFRHKRFKKKKKFKEKEKSAWVAGKKLVMRKIFSFFVKGGDDLSF